MEDNGNDTKKKKKIDSNFKINFIFVNVKLKFGKFKDQTLYSVPFNYVFWLSGYEINNIKQCPIIDKLEQMVDVIYDDRNNLLSLNCMCGTNPHHHSCWGCCLGKDRNETRKLFIEKSCTKEATFSNAKYFSPWAWVYLNYPEIIQQAKIMITEDSNKCLYCQKRLVPVHSDWHDRKFHKKCWKTFFMDGEEEQEQTSDDDEDD